MKEVANGWLQQAFSRHCRASGAQSVEFSTHLVQLTNSETGKRPIVYRTGNLPAAAASLCFRCALSTADAGLLGKEYSLLEDEVVELEALRSYLASLGMSLVDPSASGPDSVQFWGSSGRAHAEM